MYKVLESFLWICLIGFFAGQIARRLRLPALIGMTLAGIGIGPQFANLIDPSVLTSGGTLRLIAVTVILMKAGLGLDRNKLANQSSVALRLGFLPAACEAVVIALAAMVIFNFDFPTGLLLGCIIGAESPAVIVPGMLRLKSLGWGVLKGIPDAILVGSALSDVLLLLVFSLLMAFLSQAGPSTFTLPGGVTLSPAQLLPFQVVLQIGLGIGVGWLVAQGLVSLLTRQNWTQNSVQDALVATVVLLATVLLADQYPIFSGYLAVMAVGFFLLEFDAPLARRLRGGFDSLWVLVEIILFVLLGASIRLNVLGNTLGTGLLILGIGTLVGRSFGWYLSTLGSSWTWKEKLFLLPGNSAKATVQAAIGAIPLMQGIEGGDTILAVAVLSILVTAPLGAWAIPTFAPKLLERGIVDPTKVSIARQIRLLAAVDTSPLAQAVLIKAAELARRSDGEVFILHVERAEDPEVLKRLQAAVRQHLADIRHRFVIASGPVPEVILRVAQEQGVDEIILGKRGHRPFDEVLVGSVSQAVVELSAIPVILVEANGVALT